jgi:2-dehydro-3-deoxyglucarate aldolase/4-hydroxy-2-oxoheptanedioate aldolase
VSRLVEAARRHDRSLARVVASEAEAEVLYRAGFDFIAYSLDCHLLRDALAGPIGRLRDSLGGS